jgi:FkbM family methyltransferase
MPARWEILSGMPLIKSFVSGIRRSLDRVSREAAFEFAERSYAQEGEDLILSRLFETVPPLARPGFYVDVGAHHPFRFSNTYFFYRRGWRGLNVDAMPGSMARFEASRPGDINLQAAIAEVEETLTYFVFNEPALNGFDPELAAGRDGVNGFRIVDRVEMRTRTLADVLDATLPERQPIDFMSIDVEGYDLPVLRSSNWERYRPTFVLAEDSGTGNVAGALASQVTAFMAAQDYELCAKAVHTKFYRDRRMVRQSHR